MTDQPTDQLQDRLSERIRSWEPVGGPVDWPEEVFDELAADVFRLQFEENEPYRRFCRGRGVTPDEVDSFRDVPAAPTDVFKHVRLTRASAPVRTFRTSGTTVDRRGEHHFGTLDLYRASLVGPFRRFCVPDVDELRMLVLAPSPRDLPDSSLSFMLGELVERFGDEESDFFVRANRDGDLELQLERFEEALISAEDAGTPTMVLGTAFALVEFFDRSRRDFALADGSRIMETGGFKGKSREISREELYNQFERRLGVPQVRCVSEYSMTELSSQAYTDDLWRECTDGRDERRGVFQTPPWVRVDIVDPLDFEPIEAADEEGLIRFYDLANTESVIAVQTSDVGALVEGGGFRMLGRAPDADLRGCSLTIEEIVDASSDTDEASPS